MNSLSQSYHEAAFGPQSYFITIAIIITIITTNIIIILTGIIIRSKILVEMFTNLIFSMRCYLL